MALDGVEEDARRVRRFLKGGDRGGGGGMIYVYFCGINKDDIL